MGGVILLDTSSLIDRRCKLKSQQNQGVQRDNLTIALGEVSLKILQKKLVNHFLKAGSKTRTGRYKEVLEKMLRFSASHVLNSL